MLELIPFEEENIVGIRVAGDIDDEGLDRLTEKLREALDKHDKVRIYTEVEKFGWASVESFLKNMRMKLELFRELDKFEKEAIVSDKQWVETLSKIGDRLFPSIEVRYFPAGERVLARKWIRN